MIGKKKKAKKAKSAVGDEAELGAEPTLESDSTETANAKPQKKAKAKKKPTPKKEKKPAKKQASKKQASKKQASDNKPKLLSVVRALPFIGMVTLLCGVAFFSWKIISQGQEEGAIAYESGRYLVADIATGQITGNLLPPPIAMPANLLADRAVDATNPELSMPAAAVPEGDVQLRKAPNMALIEKKDERLLPKKSADGDVEPWKYYSRPYAPEAGKRPISVIVTGIGINSELSLAAAKLPAAISFGVSVYAPNPSAWVKSMRVQGHECYLSLPVELSNYPLSDPGPKALQPSITPAENMERLTWLLGQAVGYVGFIVPADEVFFAAQADFIEPVAKELSERGLSLLFSQSKERPILKDILKKEELVYTESHIFVRYGSDAVDVKQQLEAAEAVAERGGHSLIVIEASPVALQELGKWEKKLSGKGFQVVPASALARRLF